MNSTINELDMMDIYRLLHPKIADYTFYSNSHRTFTKKDHIMDHKTHLNKSERRDILQYLLSEHNGIKLDIDSRKIDKVI